MYYTWMNLESIGPGTKDHSVSFHLHKMSKREKPTKKSGLMVA